MKTNIPQKRRGRPPKPVTEKLHRVQCWFPLAVYQWIIKGGGSPFVRAILQAEYDKQK